MKAIYLQKIILLFSILASVLFISTVAFAQTSFAQSTTCGTDAFATITSSGLECQCVFGENTDKSCKAKPNTTIADLTCADGQYLQSITAGVPTCLSVPFSQSLADVACANAGEYITGFDADGAAVCSVSNPLPACEEGKGIAYDAEGQVVCTGLALNTELDTDFSVEIFTLAEQTEQTEQTEQQTKLLATDAQAGGNFGFSVALDGNTAIIGASHYRSSEIEAAYIFTRSGSTWTQQAKLLASDRQLGDHFGLSVALDGNTAIVGAPYEDTGKNNAGAAYLFTRTGSTWTQQAKLLANDAQAADYFGRSVALDGDTAIVGASSTTANGAGAAYIFTRTGSVWTEQTKLLASDGKVGNWFGYSVALDGNTALIGAHGEDTGGSNAGAAYVFTRTGSTWTQQTKIQASDAQSNNYFGKSVALDGNTAIVGAYGEDTGGNNAGGAAYIFTRTNSVWTQQGLPLTASNSGNSDLFGYSVALDGDTALIGAHGEDTGGAAYIFTRTGSTWTEQTIQASDKQVSDEFGVSVAIDGDTAIVGAVFEDTGGANAGAAYVFSIGTISNISNISNLQPWFEYPSLQDSPYSFVATATCGEDKVLQYTQDNKWLCVNPDPDLINEIHTFLDCRDAGGEYFRIGADTICKFARASCPYGWSQYQNYTQTSARFCQGSNGCGANDNRCRTAHHTTFTNIPNAGFAKVSGSSSAYIVSDPRITIGQSWRSDGNWPSPQEGITNGVEFCRFQNEWSSRNWLGKKSCGDSAYGTCTATVVSVGCY